ncbi:MAG TPA: hypothetical protein PKH77_05125 [Anaerolineae bacterium]|nr:hypothetical protein [Anaerolineae bacterium]
MPEDLTTLADIQEDEQNANLGTERGAFALQESLVRYGPARSIVVDRQGRLIAGEKTKRTAEKLGLPIEVVKTRGDKLVVVQREDLDLEEDGGLARALSIADNRTAELNLAWDAQAIVAEVDAGLDLSAFFYERELEQLTGEARLAELAEDEEAGEDELDPVPEMAIQPFEHYDYVVFFFRNSWDWAQVLDLLGIAREAFSFESSKGNLRRKVGICRALDGAKLLELLHNAHRDSE